MRSFLGSLELPKELSVIVVVVVVYYYSVTFLRGGI